jgi:hypothetical protein
MKSITDTNIFSFWICTEKLPYISKLNYSVIEHDETHSRIEVKVDAFVLSNLFYAGVQNGIAEAFKTIKQAS